MSAHCLLTGAEPGFGNRISHSHRRTSRRFDPNIQRKRYWLPGEGRHVRLTLSVRGIRIATPSAWRRPWPASARGG
ncbi:hypothetical protein GCM10018793_60520 [Streptomyces sulfonofaciens]|uniref:Large ribosomal subunit protein bL28 n=1 Tax=Streptomyces sulfonofaciens TaxID=68272 RepID=A0A919GMF5_9ACTN|nr:hypothetical protein GCM10018793_60520 [Streptomyces sulfonofaciens]